MGGMERPPGQQRARDRLDAAIQQAIDHPEREGFPDGTTFLGADMPGAAEALERAIREGRAVALFFASGLEVLIRPEPGKAARRNATWAEIKARRADALDG